MRVVHCPFCLLTIYKLICAGQFYLSKVDAVRKGKLLTNSKVKLHMLNRNKVVDIDTFEDFDIAEDKLRQFKSSFKDTSWTFHKEIR